MAGLGLSEIDLSALPERIGAPVSSASTTVPQPEAGDGTEMPTLEEFRAANQPKRGIPVIGELGRAWHRASGKEAEEYALMQRQVMEGQKLRMQQGKQMLDAVKLYREATADLPPEQHLPFAQRLEQQTGVRGIVDFAKMQAADPEAARKFVRGAKYQGAAALAMYGGDVSKAMAAIKKGDVPVEAGDVYAAPDVRRKLSNLFNNINALPKALTSQLPRDATGKPVISTADLVMLSDGINDRSLRFEPEDIGVIERNPNIMAGMPLVTSAISSKMAEAAVTAQNKEPDRIDETEVKLAAQVIAAGHALPNSFSPETRSVVGGWSQTDAATFLKTGQASGINLEFGEDGKVTGMSIGGPGGEGQNKKVADEVAAKEPLVYDLRNQVKEIDKLLEKDPGAPTTARRAFTIAAAVAANADELVKNLAMDTSKLTFKNPLTGEELQDPGMRAKFEAVFPELANREAEYQAMAYNLVYTVGALRGSSGQSFSDKEQANTMKALGLTRDDPMAIRAALNATSRAATQSFKTRYRLAHGKEYKVMDEGGNPYMSMDPAELKRLNELPPEELTARFSTAELEELAEAIAERVK